MTKERILRLRKKLQASRGRLLACHPFYALLLMYVRFVASPGTKKISTNGRCIFFDPNYLERLYEFELDYLLCHQILHLVLGHIWDAEGCRSEDYHFAQNVLVNALLKKQGICPERAPHLGFLYSTIPGKNVCCEDLTAGQIISQMLFRITSLEPRLQSRYLEDSNSRWRQKDDLGQGGVLILDVPKEEAIVRETSSDGGAAGAEAGESDLLARWQLRAMRAGHLMKEKKAGDVPEFLQRLLADSQNKTQDWKRLLQAFLQEQLADYSFSPPDRRFSECDFFLPDFTDKDASLKQILFMVDTSGSVSNEMLGKVYSELRAVCEQFSGKLDGRLGFFDAAVEQPRPFSSVDDLLAIRPVGGGGTDFCCVFRYLREQCAHALPACVVLFTDGEGPYPPEQETLGVPVLWLMPPGSPTPPFGSVVIAAE